MAAIIIKYAIMTELEKIVTSKNLYELKKFNKYDINSFDKESKTLLHYAAYHNWQEGIEYLLANGADINLQGQHKYTPLHWAAVNDSTEAVKILLKNDNINVNLTNNINQTADQSTDDEEIIECIQQKRKATAIGTVKKGCILC